MAIPADKSNSFPWVDFKTYISKEILTTVSLPEIFHT
jgi:hypothetical protein